MFSALRRRRAARRYAALLPAMLLRGYGASESYTPAQIEAAVRRAQLPLEYIAIGYAAYLSEESFRQLAVQGDYNMLRALFKRWQQSVPAYGVEAQTNTYPGIMGSDI